MSRQGSGGPRGGQNPTSRSWEHVNEEGAPPPKGRRREILEMLRASSAPLNVVEMATRLDVHPNTVRFHLDALVDAGQVDRVDVVPGGPGRPPLVFRAHRGMDPSGPSNYRLLAAMLAYSLAAMPDPAAGALELGRRWGGYLIEQPTSRQAPTANQAVKRLMALLRHLRFSPERRSDGGRRQIGLRHCPFLDLVDTQSQVICPLHLGLMQGAMSQLGSPVTVDRLDPFAEPDLCVAHLSMSASTA